MKYDPNLYSEIVWNSTKFSFPPTDVDVLIVINHRIATVKYMGDGTWKNVWDFKSYIEISYWAHVPVLDEKLKS